MSEYAELDRLVDFKPFYNQQTTARLLDAYKQKPWVFKPELVSQLKNHAVHYKMDIPEPPKGSPRDSEFDLLRGIKGMGEGFLSGFSTFNVGEPSQNEYERIMRSIGQLGGFVGYIPSAPFKVLGMKGLAEAARALKGNSVPLWLSNKATEKVAPIVSKTLTKAAEVKNSAYSDVAKFLTTDNAKHVAEGAFNLGVASSISAWQLGVNEMLKAGLHGGLTGGAFRGIANLVNKGGIPKLDQETGKMVYTATQNEDRLIRAAASSLYEGLQSSMRGETTPEQIYSYLLGAYFGAHETTAGQMRAMRFTEKVEQQAKTTAKELKRLDENGNPFQWDMQVYDPRLVKGFDDLPKDIQESVISNIAMRHGTFGSQAVMAGETIDGIKDAIDVDITSEMVSNSVREAKINEAAKKYETKVEVEKQVTPEYIEANQEKVFLTSGELNKEGNVKEINKNVIELPLKGMTDETLPLNRKRIKEALDQIPEGKKVVIPETIFNALKNNAPDTLNYLQKRIGDVITGREKAREQLEKDGRIDSQKELDKVEDFDIGDAPDVIIRKKARFFVSKYLPKVLDGLDSEAMGVKKVEAEKKIYDILEKHKSLDKFDKFLGDIQKAFPEQPAFDNIAEGELRQMLIRKVEQRPTPHFSLQFFPNVDNRTSLMVLEGAQAENLAGNLKSTGDSVKAIEFAYENIYRKATGKDAPDRAYMVLDHAVTQRGNKLVEIPLKDLNKKGNFTGWGGKSAKRAQSAANKLLAQSLKQAHELGYYYNGGKGDSGKMYFFKYHPDVVNVKKLKPEVDGVLKVFKETTPDAVKHYNKLKNKFINRNKAAFNRKEASEYFDRSFLSNLMWDKELYGLKKSSYGKNKDGSDRNFIHWIRDNSSIKDAKGFNKRNQIWMTDGFQADAKYFNKIYQEMGGDKSMANGQVSFRLFKEADNKNLTSDDKAVLYTESTDGSILAEATFVDALNKTFGMPESGQNKSFIVGSDPTHGAMLGKFMFHKATPEASEYMRKEGIQFLMPESAAKEYGSRKIGELKVNDDLSVDYTGGETYKMNLSDIRGSLSEKQSDHMLKPQLIPKQLMANLHEHAFKSIPQEQINKFFNEIIGDRYIGEESWNARLNQALKQKELTRFEQDEILDNIDKLGLSETIDAIKSENHPQFVARIYQKILRSNVDRLTQDYSSGEISRAEYLDAVAEAKTFTSNINRLMEIYPDLAIFLHKDVRNYLQSSMRNFVVNKVVRPKWDTSISVRMRGYDPWLVKKFPELNFNTSGKGAPANRKILKERYGVENPDQLFFLDDYYKDVSWDVSNIITSSKQRMTLGELWSKYGHQPKVKEFFKTISLRVPMDSISGAHELTFAGFTGIKGHGAVFHPRTMRALGGADLDGDKAFVLFGLDKAHRKMYHDNKYEYRDPKSKIIKDNKTAEISKEGLKVLKSTLDPNNAHDAAVLAKIKQGKVTYQDLLTTTNDGDAKALELKKSIVGKYTPQSRMDIAADASTGRDQLGPAVVQKQVLNSTYDALLKNSIQRFVNKKGNIITTEDYEALPESKRKGWKADYREAINFSPRGEKKAYTIYIEPRVTEAELAYSRELSRAQIGFGSDPLDEVGLTGADHYFNTGWHSLFKIDWNNAPKDVQAKFVPHFHARKGTYKIFADFNKAYFSRNWDQGRRFYAHEVYDMSQGIHKLNEAQRGTMLPKMVEILEPLDYTDDIIRRVNPETLEARYEDFNSNLALELKGINDGYNKPGGLLGRESFKSVDNPIIYRVIGKQLYLPKVRAELAKNPNLYKELFEDLPGQWKDKKFLEKSFPWEHANKYKSVEDLAQAISDSESYRFRAIDRLYRQGTEFAQNDAMDRTSAIQLLRAIKDAREKGVSDEFINNMANFVNHTKQIERAQKLKAAERSIVDQEEVVMLDDKGKYYLKTLFEVDPELKTFALQEKIDTRIRGFKLNNAWKKKQGGEGVLTKEESYLFDTMMLSSYYKGPDLTKLAAYKKLNNDVRQLVAPLIKEIQLGGSGTYFNKTGLSSKYVNDGAIRDFFKQYAEEFNYVSEPLKESKTTADMETKGELKEIAPQDPMENDLQGVMDIRERAKKAGPFKLTDAERKMVDELIGHIKHYHNSVGSIDNLNLIARGLRQKNFDAFTVDDFRVMNNFFREMRTGSIFVKPGKLTADGIVKLSQRHWMLFPRAVSKEMMVKDFTIFEQQGRFQNFKGEWVGGTQGVPTHTIENIQYVLGRTEALAVKMDQDEKIKLETELRDKTGYESVEDGLGYHFAEIVSAERALRAFKGKRRSMSSAEYHTKKAEYEASLKEAKELANWAENEKKVFNVSRPGGSFKKTGREIANDINNVLTNRAIETFKWIRGSHYMFDTKSQTYIRNSKVEDPIEQFILKDKKGKNQYWANNTSIPKIDAPKFTRYLMNILKSGEPMKMNLGLDNLRKISRSIMLDRLMSERSLVTDKASIELYDSMILSLQNQKLDLTNYYKPNDYHPQFIHNKAVAKAAIEKAIDKIKSQTGKGPDWQKNEIKKLMGQYKSMTGDWIISDITQDTIEMGALREIADKRKGEHLSHLEKNPIAPNMMSRSSDLPGWSRDIGSWDIYQKNLIDTYFRQIGQIMSKKMLQDFSEKVSVEWKDPGQVHAWKNYIQDYISRALGFPSKLPENWMDGPEADLMKVKGTPYSWYADNHVKNRLNKIRKSLGFKEDLRLPEELRGLDEMDIRHWSNLEAKYEMATLLAHPKSAAANIFGGTLHTIQSSGWRNWRNGRSVEYFRTHVGGDAGKWKSKEDIDKWVIGHGVVPDFILYEAGLNPSFKSAKWKHFLNDAKKVLEKDPNVKDETLISIAKKHKITESAFQKAAWFMREPERMLRRDSFAAHYLQARELYGHSNMPLDHPLLIEMAKKGVQATQFLYSAPYRPAFSTTALGKVMTRFQTWAWNSVRFRNDAYRQAKMLGFRRGTPEFEKFKRQYLTDMFVFGLGNVFAYSLFESAMPAPWNWFQDTADWIFGDEKERDRAFFGQWPTALAPLQMVTPPGLRLVPATFSGLVNNDFSRISEYYMWTMFPFGRMARDTKGILENPMRTIEKTTGIPYQQMAREITKYRVKDDAEE